MRFLPTTEQEAFVRSLDAMLSAADVPSAARAWAAADHAPGREILARLATAGVFALAAPEAYEGVGPLPVEMALVFVEMGRHAVPGPVVETAAAAALLTRLAELGDIAPAKRLLPGLVTGGSTATLALGIQGPYTLDTDAATVTLVVRGGGPAPTADVESDAVPGWATPGMQHAGPGWATSHRQTEADPEPATHHADADPGRATPRTQDAAPGRATSHRQAEAEPGRAGSRTRDTAPGPATPDRLAEELSAQLVVAAGHGPVRVSADPVRRLAVPDAGGEVIAEGPHVATAAAHAAGIARLVTAAQALGVGLALLERTVAHVKQRTQFGVPVGSFQAVRHRLADTLIGLEFARPLLHGAAVTLAPADIAAAKVAAGEAAYAAARTALQLHGAVGYTDELDLALWLRKARPLRDAWGTPSRCRATVAFSAAGG